MRLWLGIWYCLLTSMLFGGQREKVSPPTTYFGLSDASGAVPITTELFAVADDETNPIRIYRRDRGGPPIQTIDLSNFLNLDPQSPEADLEAATRIGDRAYWIGSHGQNKRGKDRPNRHCFFATTIKILGDRTELIPVGQPYKNLLIDLIKAPQLQPFHLARAARKMAKERDALNIEGLCSTPEGQLLIGFRNPIPKGRALIVPMLNPNEVIQGRSARLGNPIMLNLGGLGIRDIARWQDTYVIIAGPYDYSENYRLYFWKGGDSKPDRIRHVTFKGLNPEAILIYPDQGPRALQILSDDGITLVNNIPDKELPVMQRRFRSVWVFP